MMRSRTTALAARLFSSSPVSSSHWAGAARARLSPLDHAASRRARRSHRRADRDSRHVHGCDCRHFSGACGANSSPCSGFSAPPCCWPERSPPFWRGSGRSFTGAARPCRRDGRARFAWPPRGFTIMSPYFSLAENARAINREIAAEPGRRRRLRSAAPTPRRASSIISMRASIGSMRRSTTHYAQRVLGLGRDYYWDEAALRQAWDSPRRFI